MTEPASVLRHVPCTASGIDCSGPIRGAIVVAGGVMVVDSVVVVAVVDSVVVVASVVLGDAAVEEAGAVRRGHQPVWSTEIRRNDGAGVIDGGARLVRPPS